GLKTSGERFSLSPGERAGVRGNGASEPEIRGASLAHSHCSLLIAHCSSDIGCGSWKAPDRGRSPSAVPRRGSHRSRALGTVTADCCGPGRSAVRWLGSLIIGICSLAVGNSAVFGRPPWTSNHVAGSPNPPAPYAVERIYPTLNLEHPVDLAFLPGTDRLVIADQVGRVWAFNTGQSAARAVLMLDLHKHHEPLDGVLGFVFHPGFATNRFVFVNYNEPGGRPGGAYISRFTLSSLDPPVIDPATERVFLRWLSGGHNGCTLAFG